MLGTRQEHGIYVYYIYIYVKCTKYRLLLSIYLSPWLTERSGITLPDQAQLGG